ncbi:MAG: MMPL family transporter [Deltaproteobacteria bacterium]|nr:MMPL family transporter [Deltaproteobacteria bacterium]
MVALLLTVASALLARRLVLDTDVVGLLPHRLETAAAFARFARAFGGEQTLVVLATGDDPEALRRFADAYAAALGRSSLVRAVRHRVGQEAGELLRRHLAVLLDDDELAEVQARVRPAALEARARRLRALAQGPGGGAVLERRTRDPLEVLPLLGRRLGASRSADPETGYFAARDGRALLLFVTPARPPADLEFDAALERLALTTAAAVPEGRGMRVRLTGAPAYHLAYATMLRGDLVRSTTFSLVAVLLLFALFFRVVRILPWLALALGAGTLWTLGAAAVLFQHLGAVSLAFAAILLGIGIDVPVQLYNRMRVELPTRPPREALAVALADMLRPSLLALLGPAAVFGACALSQFRGLHELGALAAVGLSFSLAATLGLFPALLLVLPPRLWVGPSGAPAAPRLLGPWGRFCARRPRLLALAAAVMVLGSLPLAAGLRLTPQLLDERPAGLAPADPERAIDAAFGLRGGSRIVGLAEADGPTAEAALRAGDAWAREATRLQARQLLTAHDTLATVLPSAEEQSRRLARLKALDPERVARDLAVALEAVGIRAEPFVAGLAPLRQPARIDRETLARSPLQWALALHLREHDGRWTGATFLHPAPDSGDRLARELHDAARRVAAAAPTARVSVTGGPLLGEALRVGLERDLVLVTGASVALTLALLLGYYRRGRPAALVLLSLGAAWVLFAALLRALGVPLNLFTLLAVPFVLGYGIDDHVFLVHRAGAGAAAAVATTGRAVALTSLSTAAGFGGLLLARHEGLRQLGAAGSLAVLACLLAALALAPALLRLLLPPRA